MPITAFDHVSFPTTDAERLVAFYTKLGCGTAGLDEWRRGERPTLYITLGDQKITIHPEDLVALEDAEWFLRAPSATPGCADICFVWEGGLAELIELLGQHGIPVIAGPNPRLGGRAASTTRGVSLYVRDPDDNLIEFMSYEEADVRRWGNQPAGLPSDWRTPNREAPERTDGGGAT